MTTVKREIMLKGQAKTDYQRKYMRKRRAILRLNAQYVRPNVRPNLDGKPTYKATIRSDHDYYHPLQIPGFNIDADGNPYD